MCEPTDSIEPEAKWANQFNTGFRPCVIELVFYQSSGNDDDDEQRVVSRIVTSPDHARDFFMNLQGTIEKYEEKYGPISSCE